LLLVGCYAARIETGLPPSTKVIRQPFASSWIYGLVPPKTVTTAAECPNGVAIVETQLSFLNQVVGFLTLGIYTPMQIVVTCAEKPSMGMADPSLDLTIPQGSSQEDVQALFSHAADEAVRLKRPVRVGRE
jgi:hypothetical protein